MKHNLTELIESLTRLRDAKILPPDAPVVAWITAEKTEPLARHVVSGVGVGFCNTAKATCATIKIASEVYGAVINHRKGVGCELKPAYYKQAVKNLAHAAEHKEQQDLIIE